MSTWGPTCTQQKGATNQDLTILYVPDVDFSSLEEIEWLSTPTSLPGLEGEPGTCPRPHGQTFGLTYGPLRKSWSSQAALAICCPTDFLSIPTGPVCPFLPRPPQSGLQHSSLLITCPRLSRIPSMKLKR